MSTKFIKSPLYENWICKQEHIPKKSLKICSPYFKKNAIEQIFKLYGISENKCTIDIEILIRGQLNDFLQGSSDISALELLTRIKGINLKKVRRLTNLHMKSYLIDNKSLLIGSGNCTTNGLFANKYSCNVEAAISTDNCLVIQDFNDYYNKICNDAENFESFYQEIVEQYAKYISKNPINKINSNNIDQVVREKEKEFRHKFELKKYIKQDTKKIKNENEYTINNQSSSVQINLVESNIKSSDVPQFSNFEDGVFKVPKILNDIKNTGVTYSKLGEILADKEKKKKDGANKKYGENHSKLAELLNLVTITHKKPKKIYLTKLGENFLKLDENEKKELIKVQILQMKIVKDIINKCKYSYSDFDIDIYLRTCLDVTTANRRRPNVKALFEFLKDNGLKDSDIDLVLKKFK